MGVWSQLSSLIPMIPDDGWPLWLPPSPARWQRMLTSAESERAARRRRFAGGSLPGGVQVAPGDRWYILGDSGSGKTTFTGHLVRNLRRVFRPIKTYVHDAKGDDFFDGWPGLVVSERPPLPLSRPGGVQVWRPSTIGTAAITATERWLERIQSEREPAIIWFNEIKLLSKGRGTNDFPAQIGQLYTTGRSLGMQPITESQEVAYMPRQIGGQSSHFVYFGLRQDPYGARIAARMLGHFDDRGNPEPRQPPGDFGLMYRHLGRRNARTWEYPSYRDFF